MFWPLSRIVTASVAVAVAVHLPLPCGAQNTTKWDFFFGTRLPSAGLTVVAPTTTYSRERGYGFELPVELEGENQKTPHERSSLCSAHPFLFSVAVPEGNYNVAVTLGSENGASSTTIKAEARRLMLQKVQTKAREFLEKKITVNVRTPEIGPNGHVGLKPQEVGSFDWDDKLTLEFNGTRPCVSSLEITKVHDAVTVYLVGDSTVVDQVEEPWAAWGQMLPRFLGAGVAVANHAESGESLKSFIRERRFDKVLSTINKGDYLFIQFAHNDEKQGASYSATHVEGATYKAYLNVFIEEARSRGAFPVLVTSMHRRSFGPDGAVSNTLQDYPEVMRELARDKDVALIDLNSMSKTLYEALGPEKSVKAFVHYPAGTFPGQTAELKDDTHFNAYGAYELAKCVVEGIKSAHLGVAKYLVDDAAFDPSHPDPVESFDVPASPFRADRASSEKP